MNKLKKWIKAVWPVSNKKFKLMLGFSNMKIKANRGRINSIEDRIRDLGGLTEQKLDDIKEAVCGIGSSMDKQHNAYTEEIQAIYQNLASLSATIKRHWETQNPPLNKGFTKFGWKVVDFELKERHTENGADLYWEYSVKKGDKVKSVEEITKDL